MLQESLLLDAFNWEKMKNGIKSANRLQKYCFATLADLQPVCNNLRKQTVGSKHYFVCRENGMIEVELERMEDELYNFEREI